MNSPHSTQDSRRGRHTVVITRIAPRHWHALEDDLVVGRGEVTSRPDGRRFLSIDSWHGDVFDRLAAAMLAELPTPLHTVVDEADSELLSSWKHAGLVVRRREWEYLVPTTGFGPAAPPSGVTIVPAGAVEDAPLRELDRAIRDEVEATVGWQEMPAEILPKLQKTYPAKYAVAVESGRYVGLIRVVSLTRQPRIGLLAVRAEWQRRGIGRALLAHALTSLQRFEKAAAEINESNKAATALFESAGARRVSSNLELVTPRSENRP